MKSVLACFGLRCSASSYEADLGVDVLFQGFEARVSHGGGSAKRSKHEVTEQDEAPSSLRSSSARPTPQRWSLPSLRRRGSAREASSWLTAAKSTAAPPACGASQEREQQQQQAKAQHDELLDEVIRSAFAGLPHIATVICLHTGAVLAQNDASQAHYGKLVSQEDGASVDGIFQRQELQHALPAAHQRPSSGPVPPSSSGRWPAAAGNAAAGTSLWNQQWYERSLGGRLLQSMFPATDAVPSSPADGEDDRDAGPIPVAEVVAAAAETEAEATAEEAAGTTTEISQRLQPCGSSRRGADAAAYIRCRSIPGPGPHGSQDGSHDDGHSSLGRSRGASMPGDMRPAPATASATAAQQGPQRRHSAGLRALHGLLANSTAACSSGTPSLAGSREGSYREGSCRGRFGSSRLSRGASATAAAAAEPNPAGKAAAGHHIVRGDFLSFLPGLLRLSGSSSGKGIKWRCHKREAALLSATVSQTDQHAAAMTSPEAAPSGAMPGVIDGGFGAAPSGRNIGVHPQLETLLSDVQAGRKWKHVIEIPATTMPLVPMNMDRQTAAATLQRDSHQQQQQCAGVPVSTRRGTVSALVSVQPRARAAAAEGTWATDDAATAGARAKKDHGSIVRDSGQSNCGHRTSCPNMYGTLHLLGSQPGSVPFGRNSINSMHLASSSFVATPPPGNAAPDSPTASNLMDSLQGSRAGSCRPTHSGPFGPRGLRLSSTMARRASAVMLSAHSARSIDSVSPYAAAAPAANQGSLGGLDVAPGAIGVGGGGGSGMWRTPPDTPNLGSPGGGGVASGNAAAVPVWENNNQSGVHGTGGSSSMSLLNILEDFCGGNRKVLNIMATMQRDIQIAGQHQAQASVRNSLELMSTAPPRRSPTGEANATPLLPRSRTIPMAELAQQSAESFDTSALPTIGGSHSAYTCSEPIFQRPYVGMTAAPSPPPPPGHRVPLTVSIAGASAFPGVTILNGSGMGTGGNFVGGRSSAMLVPSAAAAAATEVLAGSPGGNDTYRRSRFFSNHHLLGPDDSINFEDLAGGGHSGTSLCTVGGTKAATRMSEDAAAVGGSSEDGSRQQRTRALETIFTGPDDSASGIDSAVTDALTTAVNAAVKSGRLTPHTSRKGGSAMQAQAGAASPGVARIEAPVDGDGDGDGDVLAALAPGDEEDDEDTAGAAGTVWHEVEAVPMTVGSRHMMLLIQSDVTDRVAIEASLAQLTTAQLSLLEQLFPRHILEHLAAAAVVAGKDGGNNGAGSNGSASAQHSRAQHSCLVSQSQQALETGQQAAGAVRADAASLPVHTGASNTSQPQTPADGGAMAQGTVATAQGTRPRAMPHFPDVSNDIESLATFHDMVSILFMDCVGFTEMSKAVSAGAVMAFVNRLFTHLDWLVEEHGLYKVETIGDAYIVTAGLLEKDSSGFQRVKAVSDDPAGDAAALLRFAAAALQVTEDVPMPHNGRPVQLRMGIHSGACVTGLVGTKLPKFSVYGDTMNTASRMETTSKPGCIHVSNVTHTLLGEPGTRYFSPTFGVEVKGLGRMNTWIHDPKVHCPIDDYYPPDEVTISLPANIGITAAEGCAVADGAAAAKAAPPAQAPAAFCDHVVLPFASEQQGRDLMVEEPRQQGQQGLLADVETAPPRRQLPRMLRPLTASGPDPSLRSSFKETDGGSSRIASGNAAPPATSRPTAAGASANAAPVFIDDADNILSASFLGNRLREAMAGTYETSNDASNKGSHAIWNDRHSPVAVEREDSTTSTSDLTPPRSSFQSATSDVSPRRSLTLGGTTTTQMTSTMRRLSCLIHSSSQQLPTSPSRQRLAHSPFSGSREVSRQGTGAFLTASNSRAESFTAAAAAPQRAASPSPLAVAGPNPPAVGHGQAQSASFRRRNSGTLATPQYRSVGMELHGEGAGVMTAAVRSLARQLSRTLRVRLAPGGGGGGTDGTPSAPIGVPLVHLTGSSFTSLVNAPGSRVSSVIGASAGANSGRATSGNGGVAPMLDIFGAMRNVHGALQSMEASAATANTTAAATTGGNSAAHL